MCISLLFGHDRCQQEGRMTGGKRKSVEQKDRKRAFAIIEIEILNLT